MDSTLVFGIRTSCGRIPYSGGTDLEKATDPKLVVVQVMGWNYCCSWTACLACIVVLSCIVIVVGCMSFFPLNLPCLACFLAVCSYFLEVVCRM